MKLYLISGLGADSRIFTNLKIDAEIIHLPWILPEGDEPLTSYVKRLGANIDTSEEFFLGGLSFGGICAQELAKFIKPKKLILISTVKEQNEFPPFLRMVFRWGLYKLVPDIVYKRLAYGASRLMGLVRKSSKMEFKSMVAAIDKGIFGWSVEKLATWKGGESSSYLHIHSSTDKILPSAYIKNATLVEGGGHLVVINRAKEVSTLINRYFKD